jgi:hypothetical protein
MQDSQVRTQSRVVAGLSDRKADHRRCPRVGLSGINENRYQYSANLTVKQVGR